MSKEITLIFVIIIMGIVILVLLIAVLYLCRILYKVDEKVSDLELAIHFATDNYLINERKRQKEDGKTGEFT